MEISRKAPTAKGPADSEGRGLQPRVHSELGEHGLQVGPLTTGDVWIDPITRGLPSSQLNVAAVHFSPGAPNAATRCE